MENENQNLVKTGKKFSNNSTIAGTQLQYVFNLSVRFQRPRLKAVRGVVDSK